MDAWPRRFSNMILAISFFSFPLISCKLKLLMISHSLLTKIKRIYITWLHLDFNSIWRCAPYRASSSANILHALIIISINVTIHISHMPSWEKGATHHANSVFEHKTLNHWWVYLLTLYTHTHQTWHKIYFEKKLASKSTYHPYVISNATLQIQALNFQNPIHQQAIHVKKNATTHPKPC